ncbi:MAG: folylpolyglutamate synthase/dihydrofolate synthase family protein [Saprospiraceae bacterium]|nr:folylpolyglutamate synthase/dihydrofolate synthase family protein [Saprospiraceae bacterium]MDZ4702438.1 folylpolyglutamate synthase/dihydrofolate synthase family protein [Saprospiraceae bacterium]
MTFRERYQLTLDYLFEQLPMFQRIGPPAFKKGLGNTLALLEALDNPQQQFRAIHIAGTNGKGSVAHLLAAILQASGYRTGLYISPHYKDFRERIKVNGQYVNKAYVVDFSERHRALFDRIQPSFFEITVAMAFDYFAKQKVEVAVVETGLGGRLDSTNVLTPVLSVITNISFDHQQFLGDTLPLIAAEKAGIIKAHIPVVIGETHPETKPVFVAKAVEMEAPIVFADEHWKAAWKGETGTHSTYELWREGQPEYLALHANLHGRYQSKNLQTVAQAVDLLQNTFNISTQNVRDGLFNLTTLTKFMGRWQVIGTHPAIICDSAHNEGGLKLTLEQVAQYPYENLHLVMGTVSDKELKPVLELFPKHARYYFCKANIPRGLDAKQLQFRASQEGLKGRAYVSVKRALQAAKRQAKPGDLIFVTGSIFVVAEVL